MGRLYASLFGLAVGALVDAAIRRRQEPGRQRCTDWSCSMSRISGTCRPAPGKSGLAHNARSIAEVTSLLTVVSIATLGHNIDRRTVAQAGSRVAAVALSASSCWVSPLRPDSWARYRAMVAANCLGSLACLRQVGEIGGDS